jgi:hypothetical protein
MSTQLYINDSITTAERFTGAPCEKKGNCLELSIDGISIHGNEGCYYCIHCDDRDVPKVLLPHVKEISFRDCIITGAQREVGIYKHASATAEVNFTSATSGTNLVYLVSINGKILDDIRTLLQLIKTGAISASESFEGKQQGETRAELEEELRIAKTNFEKAMGVLIDREKELSSAESKLLGAEKKAEEWRSDYNLEHSRVMRIYRLLAEELPVGLFNKRFYWPWCSKRKCAAKIHHILNDSPNE